jgi:hypothetical protein
MLPLIIGAVGLYLLLNKDNKEEEVHMQTQSTSFNPQVVSVTPSPMPVRASEPTVQQVPPMLATEPTGTKQVGGMSIYHF